MQGGVQSVRGGDATPGLGPGWLRGRGPGRLLLLFPHPEEKGGDDRKGQAELPRGWRTYLHLALKAWMGWRKGKVSGAGEQPEQRQDPERLRALHLTGTHGLGLLSPMLYP